jgi:Zn-finger nucleic acid-binding protein
MHEAHTESHYGLTIILDQCPDCGGLWVDAGELRKTKAGAARKIEKLDARKLKQVTRNIDYVLKCPRDNHKLVPFQDQYFPRSVLVQKCPTCHGFWFNRGEFTVYQDEVAEKKRLKAESNPELEKKIKTILKPEAKTKSARSLDRLGRFITRPQRGSDFIYLKRELRYAFDRYVITMQAVIMLIRLLLRILLKA